MARQIEAIDGTTWTIERHWARRPRWHGPRLSRQDLKDLFFWAGMGEDSASEHTFIPYLFLTVLTIARLLIGAFLALLLLLPEFLLRAAAIYLFRGRWVVEARKGETGQPLRYRVKGRGRSRDFEEAMIRKLKTGLTPSSTPELAALGTT